MKKASDKVVGDLMAKTQQKRWFADAETELYRLFLLHRKRKLKVSTG